MTYNYSTTLNIFLSTAEDAVTILNHRKYNMYTTHQELEADTYSTIIILLDSFHSHITDTTYLNHSSYKRWICETLFIGTMSYEDFSAKYLDMEQRIEKEDFIKLYFGMLNVEILESLSSLSDQIENPSSAIEQVLICDDLRRLVIDYINIEFK